MTKPIYSVIPASNVFKGAWDDYGIVMQYCRLDHTDLVVLSLELWGDLHSYTTDESQECIRDLLMNTALSSWRSRKRPSFSEAVTVANALERTVNAFRRCVGGIITDIIHYLGLNEPQEIRPVTYLDGRHLLVEIKGTPLHETLPPADPAGAFAKRLAAVIATL